MVPLLYTQLRQLAQLYVQPLYSPVLSLRAKYHEERMAEAFVLTECIKSKLGFRAQAQLAKLPSDLVCCKSLFGQQVTP